MDPVISQVYTTLIPALPYVIGAYLLMWAVLAAALVRALRTQRRLLNRIDLLERQLKAASQDQLHQK